MNTKIIYIDEKGSIIYKGVDLKMTPNELHDLKVHTGNETQYIIDKAHQSIIEKRRSDNLEILLD